MVTVPALAFALLSALASTPLSTPPDPTTPVTTQESSADALSEAQAALASDERPRRLGALKALTKIGGDDALDAVIAALADPDPYVADLAQTLVAEFDDKLAMGALLGKHGVSSKKPRVQLRAAEALGRLEGPVDAQLMLRWVKKRDVRLARTMLWSLERLAARDALGGKPLRTIKAVRLLTGRGDHDSLRAAAIQTLSILDPWDGAISMDNLKNGCGAETACALMDVIMRLKPTGYEGALRRGMEHDQPGVRMRALDVLMTGGIKRPDLDALITRLEEEPRTAIRRRVLQALQYFTGHGESDDVEAWKTFTRELDPTWTSGETVSSLRNRPNVHGQLGELDGLDPTSDRVAVLVDISTSYWGETMSRNAMARSVSPAVSRIIQRIDQTGSFLLVPFSEAPIPFSTKPIAATPANAARATSYLLEDMPNEPAREGSSNIVAAIDHALSFPEIDRIIVVSASSEYVGEHADVALMARLYEEQTRFRPAIFDFVLLNVAGPDPPRWYKLANARGGRRFQLKVR